MAAAEAEPDRVLVEFSPRMDNKNSDLLVARAVLRDGQLKGYWLFVISGEYIANAINSPYLDFAMVNNFGYASIATNPVLQDKYVSNPAQGDVGEESGNCQC